jgi:general stress protein YciG
VSKDRKHMAEIGRLGGEARSASRSAQQPPSQQPPQQ